jgi:hypothetical protein
MSLQPVLATCKQWLSVASEEGRTASRGQTSEALTHQVSLSSC